MNHNTSRRRRSLTCFGPVLNLTVVLSCDSSAFRTLSPNDFNAFPTSPTTPCQFAGMAGMFGGGNFISPCTACAPATPSNTNAQARSFALRQESWGLSPSFAPGYARKTFMVVADSRSQASRNAFFSLICSPRWVVLEIWHNGRRLRVAANCYTVLVHWN